MYLSKLTIKNFRKIKELTINFQSGLNVIVGPNNIGKTAVIDALRALLCKQDDNFPRFTPDDIRVGSDVEFSSVWDRRYYRLGQGKNYALGQLNYGAAV